MKKVGFIIFTFAIVVGVLFANFVSWGKVTGDIVDLPIHFGKIKGSGNVRTEARDLKDFDSLDVSGVFEVVATAGSDYSIEVEADDNLLEHINTDVDGSVLRISLDGRVSSHNPMRIRITAPNIGSLETSGAANVNLSNVKGDDFRLETSGASKVSVSGQVNDLNIESSGACRILANELTAANADIEASGASNILVNVSQQLKANASGASTVKYQGTPGEVAKTTSGASSVTAN